MPHKVSKSPIVYSYQRSSMTKNLHLEHPEDQILTGDLSVLDWLSAVSTISVKIDGAPAIVWGTNPENGKFFVGTKSVFNKKKVKICYDAKDVEFLYSEQESLAEILIACLYFLPRTENIYQGDWIGFGGESYYTPNTISYDFGEIIQENIIIAPHTIYTGDSLRDCVSSPITEVIDSNPSTCFVQPTVDCKYRFADSVDSIRNSVSKSKFIDEKTSREVRIILNAFIREGKSISQQLLEEIVGDWHLAMSYFQIIDLKEQMMDAMIVYDGPKAFIGDKEIIAEGFVRSNKYGTMKLVDRCQFSFANFNNNKFS